MLITLKDDLIKILNGAGWDDREMSDKCQFTDREEV
jgi:hypothetical protein